MGRTLFLNTASISQNTHAVLKNTHAVLKKGVRICSNSLENLDSNGALTDSPTRHIPEGCRYAQENAGNIHSVMRCYRV